MSNHGVICLNSPSAIALWEEELKGQISDGMWENSGPRDHWVFWCGLEAVLDVKGEPRVVYEKTMLTHRNSWTKKGVDSFPKRNKYGFSRLFSIVGDRMLAAGRMGRALDIKCMCDSGDVSLFRAAEYMPPTFEEFEAQFASQNYAHPWVKDYMKSMSLEVAKKFYETVYTLKDMRADIKQIKAAMATVKI